MRLSEVLPGQRRVVAGTGLPRRLERRLEALGMTWGAEVAVLSRKDGGTVILRVRGCRLAVGRTIARGVEVV